MKIIATAAVLMVLAAPTWADEADGRQANDPANTIGPIVLSEPEMDGVSAGGITSSTDAYVWRKVVERGDTADTTPIGGEFWFNNLTPGTYQLQ